MPEVGRDGLPELLDACARAILVVAVRERLLERPDHLRGRLDVGLAEAEVYRARGRGLEQLPYARDLQ